MKIKLLFVHPPKGNAFELFRAFEINSNFKVELLSGRDKRESSFIDKIRFKLKLPSDVYNYNNLLLTKNLSDFNIIFIVKGIAIKSKTLKTIKVKYPGLKLINWSQDDMYAWHNRSLYYTLGLKYYDLVCTNKSYNVSELKKIGAKHVFFHNKVFSKKIHHPIINVNSKYKHDVLFIGSLEKERFDSMNFLAINGIQVHLYTDGFGNNNFRKHHSNLVMHKGGLYGDLYAEAISNSKVTLCFLRKINRDVQTSRSLEIPACGGCMVGERTKEHLQLFKEGEEAIFFDNDFELLEKVKFILSHDRLRKDIVKKALLRCKESNYSYDDLVNKMENEFVKILEN
jgi:spore maturation protein CgeB